YFFFQAEDGIRDRNVTGVQTCALPIYQMMHPRYKVDKTYVAKVEGLITPDSIKKLRNGVVIDGKPTSRARAKIISRDAKKNTSIVSLTIHEGRYHQVKKMFDAVGHKVQKLSRTTYGTLTLDGLTS